MPNVKKDPWIVCPTCDTVYDSRLNHFCSTHSDRESVGTAPVYATKNSGVDETSITGATRDSREGKGRFDLIPPGPIRRLAQVYERGAKNRGDRNWEKGIALGRFLDSALRHINQFRDGERDEDHLAQAVWNLFGHMWTETEIESARLPEDLKK